MSPSGALPHDPGGDEVARSIFGHIRRAGKQHLRHSLGFVLDIPTEDSAQQLRIQLAEALSEPINLIEVTRANRFARGWAVKARLSERILTEAYIASLYHQLSQTAQLHAGYLAKFDLYSPRATGASDSP
jgi:hypothetical protein